jgi:hypothetical protein
MRFFPHFGNIEIFAITLPCGVAAWLSFIDPIWQAYSTFSTDGWTSIAGIALSVSASLIGAACAIYTACK